MFKLFGLSDDEIKILDLETYNKYANRNIIEQSYNRINIETTYTVDNGEIVSRVYKRMNEIDFKEKVQVHKNKINKDKNYDKDDIILSSEVSSYSITPIFEIEPPGGGGSSSNIVRSIYDSTDYMTFDSYNIYYSDAGSSGEVYIRIEIDWVTEPSQRFTDILTIGFEDVMLKEEFIGGQSYPDIHSSFTYDHDLHITYLYGPPTVTSSSYNITFDGSDYSEYIYDHNDEHYVGVEYELPKDQFSVIGYIYDSKYSNFHMQLEMNFTRTNSDTTGLTFSEFYAHQSGSGSIDWGKISLTSTPAFINYETSLFVNDPNFDDAVGGFAIFQNI